MFPVHWVGRLGSVAMGPPRGLCFSESAIVFYSSYSSGDRRMIDTCTFMGCVVMSCSRATVRDDGRGDERVHTSHVHHAFVPAARSPPLRRGIWAALPQWLVLLGLRPPLGLVAAWWLLVHLLWRIWSWGARWRSGLGRSLGGGLECGDIGQAEPSHPAWHRSMALACLLH